MKPTSEEGRFIETTASLPDATPGSTAEEQSAVQQSLEEDADVAASTAETPAAKESKSMWQRLRGIGSKQRKVSCSGDMSLSTVRHHRQIAEAACTAHASAECPCLSGVACVNCIIRCCAVLVQMEALALLECSLRGDDHVSFGLLSDVCISCRGMPQRVWDRKKQGRGS